MLISANAFNYSSILSILYFVNYSTTFILFFLAVNRYFKDTSNIFYIAYFLRYSKSGYLFFIIAFISFLGIPPLSLFAPKFAALSSIWLFGGVFVFVFAIGSVFLSFALYLQVFDILFKYRVDKSVTSRLILVTQLTTQKGNDYKPIKLFTYLSVFCMFSFLLFKDSFFVFSLFM